MTDDERAIRDLVATWMKASEAGDVNTVMSLIADDVIFMVPGREPFGKEVFRASSEAMKNIRREFSGLMTFGVAEMDAESDREWNRAGSSRSAP